MRRNGALKRCIIILILIVMLCNLGMATVTAQEPGGPKTISGMVFNAEGKDPPGAAHHYDGKYAAVIVEHNGEKETYKDPDGIFYDDDEGHYWYAVTIPAGGWSPDDTYWIEVDGTGWGDPKFTCSDHDSDANSWKMSAAGAEARHVDTSDYNFKPVIAWIFAIILAIIGIIIGIYRPLKLPFSGWPTQSSDLVPEITAAGAAEMPTPTPAAAAAPMAVAAPAAPAAVAEPVATAEPPPPADEHICPACGGKYDFIPDYERYYCYTCQKYEEKEETPPDASPGSPPQGGA